MANKKDKEPKRNVLESHILPQKIIDQFDKYEAWLKVREYYVKENQYWRGKRAGRKSEKYRNKFWNMIYSLYSELVRDAKKNTYFYYNKKEKTVEVVENDAK